MSFILDALRRAERERKAGHPPDVESVVGTAPASPSGTSRPWLVPAGGVAVIGLSAVLVGIVLFRQPTGPVEQEAPAKTSLPASITTEPPGNGAAPETNLSRQSPASVPLPADDPPPERVQQRLASLRETIGPTSTGKAAEVERAAATTAAEDTEESAPPSLPAKEGKTTSTENPVDPVSGKPPGSATKAEAGTAEEQGNAMAATDRVEPTPSPLRSPPVQDRPQPSPAIRSSPSPGNSEPPAVPTSPPSAVPTPTRIEQLSPERRAAFQGITLDAHVYAQQPDDRFVLIDMRIHRVGDEIAASGVVVEDITPEGAVLRAGDVRTLAPHP